MSIIAELYIFVMAILVGLQVVAKVPSILHTPLMSATNAFHGIILIGALILAFSVQSSPLVVISLAAVLLASINLVGGFVVTDRILGLFRRDHRGQHP